ncbi:uncharacterized protein DS421_18g616150 [Arachis hypogaea]|nr:uncharacterized protein DS421_18g616150 [Arachis hypogaea]
MPFLKHLANHFGYGILGMSGDLSDSDKPHTISMKARKRKRLYRAGSINMLTRTMIWMEWERERGHPHLAYIPVIEDEGHWFLAIVAFKDEVFYHLDALMDDEKAIRCKATIRKLGDNLSVVIGKPKYPLQFSKKYKGVTYIRIKEEDGFPTAQSRETSAISVLNLMATGSAFQHNLNAPRKMHTALGLIMEPFNEVTSSMPSIGAKV